MKFTLLVGGEAGQGVAQTAEVFGKTLTRMGYYVFNYRDYQSLIRGGHNFNAVTVSDEPVMSHEDKYDVIIAMNEETLKKHGKNLKEGGTIISGEKVDVERILKELKAKPIVGNSVFLGALMRYLKLGTKEMERVMKEEYKEYARVNIEAMRRGYKSFEEGKKLFPPKSKKKRYFLTGNQAVGLGAIASGIDIYIAYPMTPATPVLHFLAQRQLKYKYLVLQLENEIAVVNAALGASYAGAMVMVGTSGGGFALMSEALSLQGMSEVPLVVYLAQRPAPSTGVPTYTGQGDLKFALNAGHGEFPRVVVAPGDAEEAFQRTMEAFYLSYKYHVLSILVGDKHLGESHFTHDEMKFKAKPKRFLVKPGKNYKRYLITKSGISPRAVPGEGIVRATSYEHDEYGYTTEEPREIERMVEKRLRKWESLKKEVMRMEPVKVYGRGRKLIVSWGSTKGAILDAIKGRDYKFMQICYLSPFPSKEVLKELKRAREVVLVENNATGLLADVIREQTGFEIKRKILKYDARPFTPEYLRRRLGC
ncbi:pyruvate ferredoxin oxidoreductase [Nanoarchaeota archaeon]|nr:MAG: pyruvate ferredoxin oxidoreductase [Nanoarchaeota archaeon]